MYTSNLRDITISSTQITDLLFLWPLTNLQTALLKSNAIASIGSPEFSGLSNVISL